MALTDPITIPAGCGCCGDGNCHLCSDPLHFCLTTSGFVGTITCGALAPVGFNMNGNYTLDVLATTGFGVTRHDWYFSRSGTYGAYSAATGATGPAFGVALGCDTGRPGLSAINDGIYYLHYGMTVDFTAAQVTTLCGGGALTVTLTKFGSWCDSDTFPATLDVTITRGPCPVFAVAPMMGMAFAAPPEPAAPQAPTSRHAVVTLAVGQKGRDLLAVSGPLMQAAARRWGSDFRVIAGEDTAFNIGEKLRLFDYLKPFPEGYDRVFYLDADALILPTAPNPFDLFPPGRPYASDDLMGQPRAADWIDRENREVCESQGWEWGGPFTKYWNSGVWLLDAAHAPAFEPPAKPYPVYHCSEQHAVNERMRSNDYGVADFGRAWNWQWWVEHKMEPPAGTHVLHFSGMDTHTSTDPGEHARRLDLMRQFATRKLPLECVHLGVRTEFRAGCGGALCQHSCSLGLPAVPGAFCQTCPSYDAGGD